MHNMKKYNKIMHNISTHSYYLTTELFFYSSSLLEKSQGQRSLRSSHIIHMQSMGCSQSKYGVVEVIGHYDLPEK